MTDKQKATADSLIAALSRARNAGLCIAVNDAGSAYIVTVDDWPEMAGEIRAVHETDRQTGKPKNIATEQADSYRQLSLLGAMPTTT